MCAKKIRKEFSARFKNIFFLLVAMTSQNVRICFNFLSFIFFNLKINFKYKKRELRNSEGSERDIFRVSYGTIFVKKFDIQNLGQSKSSKSFR